MAEEVKRRGGRKKGGHNRGYFYRTGRGWVAVEGTRRIPLTYENGQRIRTSDVPEAEVRQAYARWLVAKGQTTPSQPAESTLTVHDVVVAYLSQAAVTSAPNTVSSRADTLFDFCFGFPPVFRDKPDHPAPTPTSNDRIHKGFGQLNAVQIIPYHVDQWLQAHPNWKGGRKSKIQAVKRAFNYAAEAKLIPANPLKGYRVPKSRGRVTYLTDEQEAALLKHSNDKLALALKVLIRTGARPGIEFAVLTAANVADHGDRMEWIWPDGTKVKGKRRVIRITDPEIIEIVRKQVKRYSEGPIFRNARHTPWTMRPFSHGFRRAVARVVLKEKITFDEDICLYSTRHTYAKRTLQGYWTGKPTNIETLARLMGNTVEVCRSHYLQWTETYNEPLWDAC